METYKIGQYVYNTTNPNLSGTIVGYSGENYKVTTEKGEEEWKPKTFTTDYHLIIRQLLEELGEMKDAFFRQKELNN
jgi:hypothetical protein